MNEEHQQLFEDFERATKELRAHAIQDGKQFHKYEILYGLAYRKLVNAGLKPKLGLKYRPMY